MSAMRAGYNAAMLAQQREAVDRVRRMQERAEQALSSSNFAAEEQPTLPAGGAETAAGSPPYGTPNGQGFSRRTSGQPQNRPNPPQRPSQAPNSILSQLFGSGRNPPPPNSAARGGSQSAAGIGSLLDTLRGGGGAGSLGSLGDSLKNSVASVSEPLARLLDRFDIDGEKLIILLVMWIIFNERGDKTLLLALGYLLL